jgi:hypothetical protein
MTITSHQYHCIGEHVRGKNATNHIDYQKKNGEDFACRPLALPVYSLDLIASVDLSISLV